MNEKRKYDSTLARMAGNIAAGLVSTPYFQFGDGVNGVRHHDELVAVAVDLASRIIAICEARSPRAEP